MCVNIIWKISRCVFWSVPLLLPKHLCKYFTIKTFLLFRSHNKVLSQKDFIYALLLYKLCAWNIDSNIKAKTYVDNKVKQTSWQWSISLNLEIQIFTFFTFFFISSMYSIAHVKIKYSYYTKQNDTSITLLCDHVLLQVFINNLRQKMSTSEK